MIAFYLVLAPSGAALSVDRWRRAKDRFWEFPQRAPWALRLIQVQISVVYLSTVWSKVQGTTWNDGTAVSYALRMDAVVLTVRDRLSHSRLGRLRRGYEEPGAPAGSGDELGAAPV